MTELCAPHELNGSLYACMFPLRGPEVSLEGASDMPTTAAQDPFLPARATSAAHLGDRTWGPDVAADYWAWPEPVLLARSQRASGDPVVFGRSCSTLAEDSFYDQPLSMRETSAASLWHVPGTGFVLALERLAAGTEVATETDHLGSLLALEAPSDEDGAVRSDGFADLVARQWGETSVCLSTLFGQAVADLPHDFTSAPLTDLVVPRATAIAGRRLIEGIVVGISSSVEDLGISDLLLRAAVGEDVDFDELDARQGGYSWNYTGVQLAGKPGRAGAVCAARSDARVAVLDLDAFSVYHDYLGWGGDRTVLHLIPLAAYLGQKARDFWDTNREIALLAGGEAEDETAEALQTRVRLTRRLRARVELRRLTADQLLHESNFKAWTNGAHLRRELAPAAVQDAIAPDLAPTSPTSEITQSLDVLERLLDKQLAEHRLQQEAVKRTAAGRTRALIETGIGVVTGAGLLGLFAALASVPRSDREISSLVSAGLWTLFAATTLAVLMAGGWALLQSPTSPRRPSRFAPALLVAGALTALSISIVGLLTPAPVNVIFLGAGMAAILITAAISLKKLHPLAWA